MATYNLYKRGNDNLGFVIVSEDTNNLTSKQETNLQESLQNGNVEFVEVFDSQAALENYARDNSIKLVDGSQIQ